MSNEQDAQETELGFVPEAETPTEETPPTEVAAEEQKPEAEKPEESDSGDETVGESSEKTPEQRVEDAKYWQGKYQDAVKEKSFTADDALSELTGSSKDILPDDSFAGPGDDLGKSGLTSEQLSNLTNDDLNAMLREDPSLGMQVMREQIIHDMKEIVTKQSEADSSRSAFKLEKDRASSALNRYISENDVSVEAIQSAKQTLDNLGVKASPRGVAAMMIKEIENQRMRQYLSQKTQEVAAETSQKVKQQALTIQPDAGKPAPPAPKTVQDSVADKFKPSTAKGVVDGLFS